MGFRLAVGFTIILGLTGCGSDQKSATATVMPDVIGLQLDVALSDIERAGIEDKVEVIGGGTFGVVNESNWQVCEQLPAAGTALTSAPRLTVDRSCEGVVPEATTPQTIPEPTASDPTSEESIQEPTGPPEAEEILTVENSADLAALLAGPGECHETVAEFAAKYPGRVIEFDGNIAYMVNHGNYRTRYDLLIYVGDYSETGGPGPSFKFENVNMLELNFVGPNVPNFITAGDNLRIVARVSEFTNGCLLLIEPVSTEVR
jgi:hypothetical protein